MEWDYLVFLAVALFAVHKAYQAGATATKEGFDKGAQSRGGAGSAPPIPPEGRGKNVE
jgi:hypothetical protein